MGTCCEGGTGKQGMMRGRGAGWCSGDLEKGRRQGTLLLSNGKSYAGEFEQDVMHGRGVFKWLDGRRYEGDYKVCQQPVVAAPFPSRATHLHPNHTRTHARARANTHTPSPTPCFSSTRVRAPAYAHPLGSHCVQPVDTAEHALCVTGYSQGTRRVLTGYSQGTHCVQPVDTAEHAIAVAPLYWDA
jgi:hypothetical protein